MDALAVAAEMLHCRDVEELKGAFPRVVATIEDTKELLTRVDADLRSRQIVALAIALTRTK